MSKKNKNLTETVEVKKETKNLTYVINLTDGTLRVKKGNIEGVKTFDITLVCPAFQSLPNADKSHDRKMSMHGFKQKLVDQLSGLKKALGRDVTVEDAESSMSEVFDNLTQGVDHWNFVKQSSGKVQAKAITLKKIEEKLSAGILTDEQAETAREIVELAFAE